MYMQWTVPSVVSLQVVWNGVHLLLGDQTGSENGGGSIVSLDL